MLPDKAVDLIDEAASKMRIDAQSMPGEIKTLESKIRQLENEEEACAQRGDYQQAADFRTERLKIQEKFQIRKSVFDLLQIVNINYSQNQYKPAKKKKKPKAVQFCWSVSAMGGTRFGIFKS